MRLSNTEKKQFAGTDRNLTEQQYIQAQSKSGQRTALVLCMAVFVSAVVEMIIGPDHSRTFFPNWITISASLLAAVGIMQLNSRPRWVRIQRVLSWSGLLLMVWTANGLPFDLLGMSLHKPLEVNWSGLVTRILALAAVVLVRLVILYPANPAGSRRPASWYGYAAFILALPYPALRICWAFGGMIGITVPGAAGSGFAPLFFAMPWILAAILSLLLVLTPHWMPRRLLLIAGWTATAIVGMIGPMACWTLVSQLLKGTIQLPVGMRLWIPCLFYASWFLWAIAAGAATRSYQLRSATNRIR